MGAHRSELARAFGERLRAVYGEELGHGARVVHVAAVASTGDGRLPVLAVGEKTPRSPTDAFALDAARTRTGAIVTTGRILRREPALSHTLTAAAAAWRREVLGEADAPWTVVLTRRPDDIAEHPLFATAAGRIVVFTDGARGAGTPSRGAIVKSLAMHAAGALAPAIEILERELGVRSVLIEAGPSTARALYRGDRLVDELLLSRYEGPPLPAEALVGEFATEADLERCFGAPVHVRTGGRADVGWSFLRYLHRA
jgi:riboflavin biosynthesis pyrimidine reductase